MTLLEFIAAHRDEIDRRIMGAVPSVSSLTDPQRRMFIRNDPKLRRWAIRAGWQPKRKE